MYNYTICYNFSTEYFNRACKALESRIPKETLIKCTRKAKNMV